MEKVLIILILTFFLLSLHITLASTCTIRTNGCESDEYPVFSVWNDSNSHAGDYSYYDKKVCCPNVTSSYVRTTCNSDEREVMTFYKANNSHAARKAYAPYKLCVTFSKYVNCVMKNSCTASEICIASLLYETNSHVADCNTYPNKICCGELIVNAEAGGPYVKNQTLPTVLIVGNVTFAGESVAYANVSIKIYEGATLKASKDMTTSSSGKFSTSFTTLDVGTYTVEVSANYSSANASANDTFKVIERLGDCTQRTVSLSGTALDYLTGSSISSGTVKIMIKENGDEFSTSFTGGRWIVTFVSCLVLDRRYTAIVQITDSSTGRVSWSEIQFIAR